MKKLVVVLFLVNSVYGITLTKENGKDSFLYKHRKTYVVMGDKQDQMVVQMSYKYPLFDKYLKELWFSYTGKWTWDILNSSSPFKNMDHNPELFYTWYVNKTYAIDFGLYEHKSNGQAGSGSRTYDSHYIRFLGDFTLGKMALSWYNKLYYIYRDYDNRGIVDYLGIWKTGLSIRKWKPFSGIIDKEELYFRMNAGGKYGIDYSKFTYELGLSFRTLIPHFKWNFFIHYYNGYVQNLLQYKQKQQSLRIGIIFK